MISDRISQLIYNNKKTQNATNIGQNVYKNQNH